MRYGVRDITFSDGETIPTICMGDGSVRVTSLKKGDDGFVGVGFSEAPENSKVNTVISREYEDHPVTGLGIYHQLYFDNPKSIDALIAILNEAKGYLTE